MALNQKYPEGFERFWREYPLKVNKGSAFKAWEKLKLSSEDVDELVLHLHKRKKDDAKWLEGKFIPHASSFLNGHRWEDEYQKARHHPTHYIKPEPDEPMYAADPEVALRALEAAKRAVSH
jgi:hypothetical protein